jgi:uncharacterized BrkB/YihY/UPF0761 family membrane protein
MERKTIRAKSALIRPGEFLLRVLVWYYSTISLVNVVYGSLTTAVVALLSIEIAVIILLFGAQVIAEFERSTIEIPQAD